jgi:hypothetical protein
MCNLYSITTNQAAIIALFRVLNRYVGNLPPMPGVFPDCSAPVVDMLRCSQYVGGGGRTRHRVANRHPGLVHVDRRTEEKNLFVRRRLAKRHIGVAFY